MCGNDANLSELWINSIRCSVCFSARDSPMPVEGGSFCLLLERETEKLVTDLERSSRQFPISTEMALATTAKKQAADTHGGTSHRLVGLYRF